VALFGVALFHETGFVEKGYCLICTFFATEHEYEYLVVYMAYGKFGVFGIGFPGEVVKMQERQNGNTHIPVKNEKNVIKCQQIASRQIYIS